MHGISEADVLLRVSSFLGWYYLFLGGMNGVLAYSLWRSGKDRTYWRLGPLKVTDSIIWLAVAAAFIVIAPLAFTGSKPIMQYISIPTAVREFVNYWLSGFRGPIVYTGLSLVGLGGLFICRKFFVRPLVAWTMLNVMLLLMGFSMTNPSFFSIVAKPDNVPIVGLVYLLGFFTWLATRQAVLNDERAKQGLPPLEKENDEKVLVWPDLVYTELICMVALTAFLLFWGLALQAPLEVMASSVKTPNPSKAPWYFLGLQEMLVYYDPWMAGVVMPVTVVFGLMAIPYIDFNKQGNGYYTIDQRRFAYVTFQVGFLMLWVTLIVLGTFLRGPNWNFFGPYEQWDAHKVEVLNNVDLSQQFWVGIGMSRPRVPEGAGVLTQFGYIVLREAPGLIALGLYFIALPPLMAMTVFRKFFVKMGLIRYMVMANLLLMMGLLPIKMIFRWTLNMKYFVYIPEYFLNF